MNKRNFIDVIVGARPNFIKVYKLLKIFKSNNFSFRLIHTGQHHDKNMSDIFFNELNIKKPHINLNIKEKTHAKQIGKIMISYEKLLQKKKPELSIVVGDVNSTLACAIVASRMNIKVAHIEAGLRSNDMSMPEETNRILTDHLSNFLFVTTSSARKNLIKENIKKHKIYLVGNTMIDTLKEFTKKIDINIKKNSKEKNFILVTLHRPENTDNPKKLYQILNILKDLSKKQDIIFPVHPRLSKKINKNYFKKIKFIMPQGYIQFISLIKSSNFVITDSGGITEECSVLNIPCITLRKSTERPETIKYGTNKLSRIDFNEINKLRKLILKNKWKKYKKVKYWDGKTSDRIYKIIKNIY